MIPTLTTILLASHRCPKQPDRSNATPAETASDDAGSGRWASLSRARLLVFAPVRACEAVAQVRDRRQKTSRPVKSTEVRPRALGRAITLRRGPRRAGMVWIPGGEFSMGCADPRTYRTAATTPMTDARPIHRVYVDGFWMDRFEVTNDQFAAFVRATGYVTVAERTPTAAEFPGAPPENLVAGSVVFTPPPQPVPLDNHYRWWSYVQGANWRHPLGPSQQYRRPRRISRRARRL